MIRLPLVIAVACGIPLTLAVVIGRLSGASWTTCLQGFLAWLAVASFVLLWICGTIVFAISNGYRLKDFLKKEGRKIG
jgi:hypothetical protein